ncbi:YhfT family protein [Thaumasiovibrio sp. DFM-14]|uniref:YhfT family protein n=1 Tax=Thaumasiovibrio sp. DFM-14 TaxID=3384792 RepID=UPI0039A39097
MTSLGLELVALLCAVTALASNIGAAIFHDGIRPLVPQIASGHLSHRNAGSMAFGLSIGFILSVGVSFTLASGFLNPWLLFLPADIIGVVIANRITATLVGGLWGVTVVVCFAFFDSALSSLSIDILLALKELGRLVMPAIALFPIIAASNQFGPRSGISVALIALLSRLVATALDSSYSESVQLITGLLAYIAVIILNERQKGNQGISPTDCSSLLDTFKDNYRKIVRKIPLLCTIGALIAAATNIGVLAGSEVSTFALMEVNLATDELNNQVAVHQAALGELVRGISFMPLIAMTALTTGVYGTVGMTFVFVVGYLSPNPQIAALLGALTIGVEIALLGKISFVFTRFPIVKTAADNIRDALNTLMEFALLIGGSIASFKMGETTGLSIFITIYMINELLGRPILKIAIPIIASISTGLILNLAFTLGVYGS